MSAAPVSVTRRGERGVPVITVMSEQLRPPVKVLKSRSGNGRCVRSNLFTVMGQNMKRVQADDHRLPRRCDMWLVQDVTHTETVCRFVVRLRGQKLTPLVVAATSPFKVHRS